MYRNQRLYPICSPLRHIKKKFVTLFEVWDNTKNWRPLLAKAILSPSYKASTATKAVELSKTRIFAQFF